MEVTNRFKGLDLVDRSEELWMEVYNIVQEVVIKTIPKKNMQEGKVVAWGGYTNGWGRKKSERQGIKGKIYPNECRVPENSKERKENLLKQTIQRNRGKQ